MLFIVQKTSFGGLAGAFDFFTNRANGVVSMTQYPDRSMVRGCPTNAAIYGDLVAQRKAHVALRNRAGHS